MRASKTRVASKSARMATDGGRSESSSASTQQLSMGMSSGLQGAVATVVLLGTVVLLMSSSLSQTAVLDAPSSLRRPALSVTTAAPPGVALASAAQAVDVTVTSEVPNRGSSDTVLPSQYVTSTVLRGRVEVEATTGQTEAAPLRISSGHKCAPPAVGAGRLAWAAIRNRTSLLPRGCANWRGGDAAPARELCRLAQAAAGDAGELLLIVGVGARAASLRLTLRSAARVLSF